MMKRVLLINALLALSLCVACRQTETAQHIESQPGVAGSGNAHTFDTANRANTNQTNDGDREAESLLLPQPTGFVNDFANVIDAPAKKRLDELLGKLKERARIEFAVVTAETTGSEKIDDYALQLARSWGIGSAPRNDGLLLLVAVRDRKWRIEVSRSLEADMPNDVVGELGRLMNEPFRAGKYGEGLTNCVEALIARLSERRGFTLS